ncbi:MAG: hypothetical protein NW241_08870 [Bacteroidia bacterium]|nr:hypothetical protein [Bacteroidia bacterium]
MRSTKASIWLALSFSCLLGHSLMPHAHQLISRAQRIESGSSAEDFWRTLGRAFTLDLGAGHLESYRASQDPADTQQAALEDTAVMPEQFRFSLLEGQLPAVPYRHSIPQPHALHGHAPQGLRAPPCRS